METTKGTRRGVGRPSLGARKQLPARVPLPLAREIESRAEALDLSVTQLVIEALTSYVEATPHPDRRHDSMLPGLEGVPLSRTA